MIKEIILTAKEFYEEWIETCDPKEGCVQQCEVYGMMDYLKLPFEFILDLEELLPEMHCNLSRWYGVRWKKQLPCNVDYLAEIRTEILNEISDKRHEEEHRGRYVYEPYKRSPPPAKRSYREGGRR